MSRYFNSFIDDYSEALEHSWGTSPKVMSTAEKSANKAKRYATKTIKSVIK